MKHEGNYEMKVWEFMLYIQLDRNLNEFKQKHY